MIKFRYLSAVLCLSIVISTETTAQLGVPPGLAWRTMETEHFFVHYPTTHAALAQKVALKAEGVHALCTSVLRHVPSEKTHIVLSDYSDVLFGATTFVFYNAIYLSPTQCTLGIGHYDDFLSFVLLHEYCHVIDMDMIGGIPEIIRTLLGRLYTPNMLCPIWMIEGFATFFETELTNGGRGIDPLYDMYLRMAFLENKVHHLDQNGPYVDTWPGGVTPYLYGESLYRYMAKEDIDKIVRFRQANSEKLWPFSFEGNLSYYWDGSIQRKYEHWKLDLHQKYERQKREIERKGITSVEQLTSVGYDTWGLEWTRDDKEILFFNSTYDAHAFIKSVDAQLKVVKTLAPVNGHLPQLSLDSQGRNLYFSQFEMYDKNALYSDVYCLEMKTKKVRRMTKKHRAFHPSVDRFGNMVYIVQKRGQTNLCLQKEGDEEVVLIEGADETYFFAPQFSPEGNAVALPVWQRGGLMDLWIYQFEDSSFFSLCEDEAWDITPSWSPDGRFILFSSDRTGVFNIFAYHIRDGAFFQITNVVGGAFYPRVSHDGQKIAFVGYHSNGFDVSVMDMPDIENLTSFRLEDNGAHKGDHFVYGYKKSSSAFIKNTSIPTILTPGVPVRKYNPLQTLFKPIRFPFLSVDDTSGVLGIFLLGKDVLNQHFYTVLASYSLGHKRPIYSIDYLNSQWYPNVLFHAEDLILPRDLDAPLRNDDSEFYWERVQKYAIGIELPFAKIDRKFSVQAGLGLSKYTDAEGEFPSENSPYFQGQLGYSYGTLRYSSARRYPRSISYEEGISVETGFERYDKALSSDHTFSLGKLSIQKYIRVPGTRHHVLFTGFGVHSTDIQNTRNSLSILSKSIRGFVDVDWRKRAYESTLEYRVQLMNVERGYGTWPVYLRQIHSSLFTDYLYYFDTQRTANELASSGIELSVDFLVGYLIPVTLSFGYAHPWKGDDSFFHSRVYWNVNLSLGGLSHASSR